MRRCGDRGGGDRTGEGVGQGEGPGALRPLSRGPGAGVPLRQQYLCRGRGMPPRGSGGRGGGWTPRLGRRGGLEAGWGGAGKPARGPARAGAGGWVGGELRATERSAAPRCPWRPRALARSPARTRDRRRGSPLGPATASANPSCAPPAPLPPRRSEGRGSLRLWVRPPVSSAVAWSRSPPTSSTTGTGTAAERSGKTLMVRSTTLARSFSSSAL